MQFVAISRRRTEKFVDADFAEVLPEETVRIRQLYADGVVRQIWLRLDVPGALFTIEANDRQAAEKVIESLPMFFRQLSDFTLVPLGPYRGFTESVPAQGDITVPTPVPGIDGPLMGS